MWDGMTGSVHDMERAYERDLDKRMDAYLDKENMEDNEHED